MKKTLILATISSIFLFSLTASAQVSSSGVQQGMGTFASIINTFNATIVKALGTLFLSSAVVAFFFGLTKFIWGLREGDPKVITNGRQFMIWSLTALFVMFSVYGIIRFFQGTVGLNNNTITIPEINYGGSGSSGVSANNNGTNQQTVYTCPDGVTIYYNQSDYNVVCGNANGGNNQNNSQTTLKANGEQCTLPSQCQSGNCQSGPYGSQCASVAAKSNGEQCTLPSQCASGNCESGPYGSVCAPNP